MLRFAKVSGKGSCLHEGDLGSRDPPAEHFVGPESLTGCDPLREQVLPACIREQDRPAGYFTPVRVANLVSVEQRGNEAIDQQRTHLLHQVQRERRFRASHPVDETHVRIKTNVDDRAVY